MSQGWVRNGGDADTMKQTVGEKQGGWSAAPHCREARRAPGLELTSSGQPGPSQRPGWVLSLGAAEPGQASICSAWLQNRRFLSILGGLLLSAKFLGVWKGFVPQTIHSNF